MAMKFRPNDEAGENLVLDVMLPDPDSANVYVLSVSEWPYEPKNPAEEAALSSNPLLTSDEESKPAKAEAPDAKEKK